MMLLVIPQQDQGLLNGLIRPITKCKAMVVELASRDDPDKSVGTTTKGIILGVVCDSQKWILYLRPDKPGSILKLLREALQVEKVQQRVLKTLYGKLEHIRGLVPN